MITWAAWLIQVVTTEEAASDGRRAQSEKRRCMLGGTWRSTTPALSMAERCASESSHAEVLAPPTMMMEFSPSGSSMTFAVPVETPSIRLTVSSTATPRCCRCCNMKPAPESDPTCPTMVVGIPSIAAAAA